LNVVALQTARAGSKSVKDKNLIVYGNHPMFLHNVIQAYHCSVIDRVYISTDIPSILGYNYGHEEKYKVIKRPAILCKDNSSHLDTMIRGVIAIEKDLMEQIDVVVVLLGNTPHASTGDLTRAITQFKDKFDEFDSCMSVGKYNMFNPFRAFHTLSDGSLTPIVNHATADFLANRKNQNDKDCFGDTYFFNGSFWILKRKTLMNHTGRSVFPWLGDKILPYEQPAYCQEIDAEWQLDALVGK